MAKAIAEKDPITGSRWYPYPADPDLRLTSITTITGGTDSKPWLYGWQSRMGARFAVDHLDMVEAVLTGRATLVATKESGHKAAVKLIMDTSEHLRDIKSRAGTYVHDVLEALIRWAQMPGHSGDMVAYPAIPVDLMEALYDGEPLPEVVAAMVDGFVQFVCDWNPRFITSEMTVYHVQLGVAGTLDMIVEIDDADVAQQGEYMVLVRREGHTLSICADAKTGRILDAPMEEQVCTYPRMKEANVGLGELAPMPHTDYAGILWMRHTFKRGYKFRIVPPARATAAWNRFLKAASIFLEREQIKIVGQTVYPPTAIEGEYPDVLIADMEGYPRAPIALDKAGFEWLSELTKFTADYLLENVKGIGDKTVPVIRAMLRDRLMYLDGESPDEQATLETAA
jgi:hypothetical protein